MLLHVSSLWFEAGACCRTRHSGLIGNYAGLNISLYERSRAPFRIRCGPLSYTKSIKPEGENSAPPAKEGHLRYKPSSLWRINARTGRTTFGRSRDIKAGQGFGCTGNFPGDADSSWIRTDDARIFLPAARKSCASRALRDPQYPCRPGAARKGPRRKSLGVIRAERPRAGTRARFCCSAPQARRN